MTITNKDGKKIDLKNHLYEACNILRGPINQDEYKSYLTPLLFFKRVSDVFDAEIKQALEESGGDYEYANFPENHRFTIPDGCHWNDIREKTENIGAALSNAMFQIERANPNTLMGVFSSFDDASWTDKQKLSDERLKDLVEHFSMVSFSNQDYSADVMGDAYEYLIKKFADMSKKTAGEFYTPRAVVKLLIKILDPKANETVYDPACGTGGMLIEAIRHMNNDKLTFGKIYGQEKNLSTSAIARMNLFLHGAEDFKIVQGDTLRNPAFVTRGKLSTFDCVIANPPFSLKKWGDEMWTNDRYGRNIWGTPPKSYGDYAWIQHMVCSMAKGTGRHAVVLPQGALFRNVEYEIRKNMVKSDKLECVISLVNNLFYGAGIPACILVFRETKIPEHKNKVLFVDATKIFTPLRAQNILTDKNVDEIYKLYRDFTDKQDFSKVVTLDEIEKNDFDLSLQKYIKKSEVEKEINIDEVKADFINSLEKLFAQEDALFDLLKKEGYINE